MRKSVLTLTLLCATSLAFAVNDAKPQHFMNVSPMAGKAPMIMHAMIKVPKEVSSTKPATPKKAKGEAVFLFNPMNNELSYTIDYVGLSSRPFMAHFHRGASTVNGPIVQTICGQPKPALDGRCPGMNKSVNYGSVSGVWHVPKKDVADLLKGDIYVNFHTKLNPNGEIRGQVLPNV
jgi:hypothetical protein